MPTFKILSRHVPQHGHDLLFHLLDVGLDLFQPTGRAVLIEVPVEVDLVTHEPDLPVLRIPACGVDPGVGNVGPYLALEERLDVLQKGHVLRVAEFRIRFPGRPLPVPADLRRVGALGTARREWPF